MYPDFICIGAQKAGTTWLERNLRGHPQVWLPPVKAVRYFNDPSPRPLILRLTAQHLEDELAPPLAQVASELRRSLHEKRHGLLDSCAQEQNIVEFEIHQVPQGQLGFAELHPHVHSDLGQLTGIGERDVTWGQLKGLHPPETP